MTRARDRLNAEARYRLKLHGLTAPAWARWCGWKDGAWHGDRCGCSDDRCMDGYHHDPHERCGCLTAMLDAYGYGHADIDAWCSAPW